MGVCVTARTRAAARQGFSLILAAVIGMSAACSATRFDSARARASQQVEPFKRVIAIAITRSPARRQSLEDAMTARLVAEAEVDAVASHTLMSAAEVRDGSIVFGYLDRPTYDAAIIMRFADMRRDDVFRPDAGVRAPAHYRTLSGYYRYWLPIAAAPDYLERDRQMHVETQLYALPSGNLIYSALSDELNPISPADLMTEVGQTVARDLRLKGLIGRR